MLGKQTTTKTRFLCHKAESCGTLSLRLPVTTSCKPTHARVVAFAGPSTGSYSLQWGPHADMLAIGYPSGEKGCGGVRGHRPGKRKLEGRDVLHFRQTGGLVRCHTLSQLQGMGLAGRSRAAEAESRQESESVLVDHFDWSRSRNWIR